MELNDVNREIDLSLIAFKEERWLDVIKLTTAAINSTSDTDLQLWKLYFRRGTAFSKLGDLKASITDLEASIEHGGGSGVKRELSHLRYLYSQTVSPSLSSSSSTPSISVTSSSSSIMSNSPLSLFTVSKSPGKQSGAFASCKLFRGNLISIEAPLFVVKDSGTGVPSKFKTLSDPDKVRFESLLNSFDDRPSVLGIWETNSFGLGDSTSGIFCKSAIFNHSCTPNAKASYDVLTGSLRVHALRTIEIGEELTTSYIGRKDLYLSTKDRKRLLSIGWRFDCICSTCTLDSKDSDRRRLRLHALIQSLPRLIPTDGEEHLKSTGRALRIIREEGLPLDSDQFTLNAASVCAYHSDFNSSKIWAKLAYHSVVEEYGYGETAIKIQNLIDDPKKHTMASKGSYKDLSKLTKEILESLNENKEVISEVDSASIWDSLGLGILGLKIKSS